MKKDHHTKHIPVLLAEVLEFLAPEKGERLLDATSGYGGHANSILEKTGQYNGSVLVDRDQNATKYLLERFKNKQGLKIVHGDFASISKKLKTQNRHFELILADLGVSSPHLDNADRGFSIKYDGPLDMRMDSTKGLTAYDLINSAKSDYLANILKSYGDEPKARRIAEAITRARPVNTTSELAQIVTKVYGAGNKKIHPATRTFQALRIAVNDELAQIRVALPLWIDMLTPGGRLAVISFHSLEDKIVKDVFNDFGKEFYDSELKILTKKPITASKNELVLNPRARSAKLRVVVKK
jgi:16S rRNA (cytosine1402-N4)-methyltransferase